MVRALGATPLAPRLAPHEAIPCALEGGLTLFHHDVRSREGDCWQRPFEYVQSKAVAFVVTWSAGSASAEKGKDYSGLVQLARFHRDVRVALVAYGKGSPCDALPSPLRAWDRALCITGHNVGARESHSILHFCTAFYDHLPTAVLFLQDDPRVDSLRGLVHDEAMDGWARALTADALARQALGGRPDGPPQPQALSQPWTPTPCEWVGGVCRPWVHADHPTGSLQDVPPPIAATLGGPITKEATFTEVQYGGYRPMAWLMRTFFADFANMTRLPSTIEWPVGAQFAVARPAVRSRPPAFWHALLALASPRAPLKCAVARRPNATDKEHARSAKWANFGPIVVDLGPLKSGTPVPADNRPGMNGMDFAQMCERLWFRIFDPALKVVAPPFPECYTAEALELGPVRCGTGQCPADFASRRPYPGGCELTDRLGLSTPPPDWKYARGENRCLAEGCRD